MKAHRYLEGAWGGRRSLSRAIVIAQLNAGHDGAADNLLDAFANELAAMDRSGRIDLASLGCDELLDRIRGAMGL